MYCCIVDPAQCTSIHTCAVYTNTVCRALQLARIIFSLAACACQGIVFGKSVITYYEYWAEKWVLVAHQIWTKRRESFALHLHRAGGCPSHGIHAKNVMQEIRLTHSKFNYSFFHSHKSTISRALAGKKPANRYYLFSQFAIVDHDSVATILISDCVGLCASKLNFYEYSYFMEAAHCHILK